MFGTRVLAALLLLWTAVAHAQIGGLSVAGTPPLPLVQQDGQTFYPNNFALGATDPQGSTETYNASRMVMMSGSCAATTIKLGFTNSTVNASSAGELTTALGTTALTTEAVSAYIEYPLNSAVTAVTSGGTSTVVTPINVAPSATTTFTDAMAVAIPAKTAYAIQTLVHSTTGAVAAVRVSNAANPMPTGSGVIETTTAQGASSEFGTAGTWTGLTSNAAIVMPLIVAATTTASTCNSVFIKGDSHVVGQTDNSVGDPGDAHGFVGFPMRALDLFTNVPPFLCACIGANKIQSYAAPSSGTNAVEKAALAYFTNLVDYDWPNDAAGATTASTIESYLSTLTDNSYAAGIKTAFVFRSPPQTNSTNWINYTGQTSVRGTQAGGTATVVNTWITSGVSAGGNSITLLDHVTGANAIGNDCTPGQALSGANTSDNGFGWCADGVTADGSTEGGEHPQATGGIQTTNAYGAKFGNSYAAGASVVYNLVLNPGATAYGALQ